jgi:hypothetical protein
MEDLMHGSKEAAAGEKRLEEFGQTGNGLQDSIKVEPPDHTEQIELAFHMNPYRGQKGTQPVGFQTQPSGKDGPYNYTATNNAFYNMREIGSHCRSFEIEPNDYAQMKRRTLQWGQVVIKSNPKIEPYDHTVIEANTHIEPWIEPRPRIESCDQLVFEPGIKTTPCDQTVFEPCTKIEPCDQTVFEPCTKMESCDWTVIEPRIKIEQCDQTVFEPCPNNEPCDQSVSVPHNKSEPSDQTVFEPKMPRTKMEQCDQTVFEPCPNNEPCDQTVFVPHSHNESEPSPTVFEPCDQTVIEPLTKIELGDRMGFEPSDRTVKIELRNEDELHRFHNEDAVAVAASLDHDSIEIKPEVSGFSEIGTFEYLRMEQQEFVAGVEKKSVIPVVTSDDHLLGGIYPCGRTTPAMIVKPEDAEFLASSSPQPGQLPVHVIDPLHGGGVGMEQGIGLKVRKGNIK